MARKSTSASSSTVSDNMTLLQLQKVLGSRINLTLDENKTPEQRQIDNEQSYLIMHLGKQMINNGTLILNIEKLAAQNHSLEELHSYKLING